MIKKIISQIGAVVLSSEFCGFSGGCGGALVFDIADLIKDSLILPWAFICAKEQMSEQEFRQQCLQNFTKHKALDFMLVLLPILLAKASNTRLVLLRAFFSHSLMKVTSIFHPLFYLLPHKSFL
jgi:CRISPR/Cas system-associated endonuclease Cas1